MMDRTEERTAQLAERLQSVRSRIQQAVSQAGRPDSPQLVVVSKFHPAADVRRLASLGVRDFGENRDPEARHKAAELEDLDVDWHFVGQLQSNKAKHVVRYASAVHSVDRVSLVEALSTAKQREQARRLESGEQPLRPPRPLRCLIQVDLDPRPVEDRPPGIGARGGAPPAAVEELAERIDRADGLRLQGVMAVAPLGLDPAGTFRRLRELSTSMTSLYPEATWISAGMSHDLEQAVLEGATHLRIGTDVLGPRPEVG
ncbi:YggS family pyridoxal phosphate-dependent enzyme [Citricoccus sp. GCM10030269]|uniref:YggS family pyridoxal phosphate-dependent enzyme n=1 Tax=Citricoccus sp. GCM10030269 TaxID=3273388 RepID=UPI003615F24C